jgi:hypothetical protein
VGCSLFACWHLSCSAVNGPCVVRASCCCNTCCCGVVSCVLRCACMCVLGDSYCVKTFYRRWFVDVCVCVDQLITNNFYFFFKYHNEIGYILFILSSSCHVMSYHVVLTSLSCVTKFFSIHFFFILCLIVVIIMSLLNVRSYSSSHHTCHHTSASVNFFFITLVAVCCYTTLVVLWDCYGLVCRFTSLCVVMKLRIKKILTDFCDTRTYFAALARACFHESHTWDESVMWVCYACV